MSLLLVWLVRLLVLFVVIRAVWRLLGLGRTVPATRTTVKDVERAGGTLVQDPQCGTYLMKSRALAVGTGDDVKFFCSTTCRDAFAAAHRQ